MTKTPRQDVYQRVTDTIIADLEAGVRTWLKPWNAGHLEGRVARPKRHNGQPYQGINTLVLWAAGAEQGFASPFWFTYRQAKELGAQVRKGERGQPVVYAGTLARTETDEQGEETERSIPYLKGYTVFNAQQIDGLPEQYSVAAETPETPPLPRHDAAERFIATSGAVIRHGGNRAYYALQADRIQLPPFETFRDPESYYATVLHELTHWTRHPSRLDRDLGRLRWGDAGYAREELVAELGAAFLCCDLGITPEPRADHADYIGSWLEVLRHDKRAIFSAAAHAQRACDHLHGLQVPTEAAA